MKAVETGIVLKNEKLAENIHDLRIRLPKIAPMEVCGQFVEVYPDNGANLLSRPISICEINEDTIRLVFQVVGKGTKIFSELKEGNSIRVLGPCGNGYPLPKEKAEKPQKFLLAGGGIGVPPLLETAKQLKKTGDVEVFLGFRNGSFLVEEFARLGVKVHIATDDGSVGFKGNVVGLMESLDAKGDAIYSCGPKIMLKFLAKFGEARGIKTYVSMEERMACGIGACVGCVLKIKSGEGYENKKVCK
ncbi:MAG: dihydroorotate dehydrogenase electron transfer subunit, partial [Clostridiales bacterium]|nr:dihydroorotate dehydrogenase electron transfer subunit [Clostridiales bacterium]